MKQLFSLFILLSILMSACVSSKKYQTLQTQLNDEQLKTKDQELKVKEVETKNILLSKEIEEVEEKNEELDKTIASLKAQLLTMKDSLSAKRGENDEYRKKYQKLLNSTNLENTTNTQTLIEKEQSLVQVKKGLVTQKQGYEKALNDLKIAKQQEIAILKNEHQATLKKLQEEMIALEIQVANLGQENAALAKKNAEQLDKIDDLYDEIDSLENLIQSKYLGQMKQKLNLLLDEDEREEAEIIAQNGQLHITFTDAFLFSDKNTKLVSPQGQIVLAKIARALEQEENMRILIRNDFDKTQNNQALATSVGDILLRNGVTQFENANKEIPIELVNAKLTTTSVILEVD